MLNCNLNKIYLRIEGAIRKAAIRPYKIFFALLALFAVFAACVFFEFEKLDETQLLPSQMSAKKTFDAARARKYRQVFETIKYRQVEYQKSPDTKAAEIFLAVPLVD